MKNLLVALFLLGLTNVVAQIKIGDSPQTINQNSILELESSDKVFVVTRISDSEMNAISPLNGAIIYNTDQNCLFQFNNNTWNSLCVNVMANETVTSLIDNNDGSVSYTSEDGTITTIIKSALTENNDGTYTFNNGNGTPITLDVSSLETVTTLLDNTDGTFTYTSENGTTTTIDTNSAETLTNIALNPDNTNISYTDENGDITDINLSALVTNLETITSLIDNNNGTFTYTDENGVQTILDINNSQTLTTIALNTDNTNIDYTDEDGNTTSLDLTAIVANLEALTTLVDNNDGTFTYTDENGGQTIINTANLETLTTLTNNGDLTFTYLNEDGTPVTISVIDNDNDPTNELQDLFLNGTELQLSNPATPGNLVDLTNQITLEMFADAPNANSEIYWNGTQWVYGIRVASVNNSVPDASGNINIPIGNVYTGPTTNTGDISTIEVNGMPQEGDIYVVNSDAVDQTQVGAAYIYDIDTMSWIEIDPFNAALYDPRYVNILGDTMAGNLDMNGNNITGLATPVGPTDATPKSYIDAIGLVDNGDGTFSLQKPDGTINTVPKATLTANLDGTYTFDNNDGNPVIINVSDLETLTTIAINTDNTNIDYVDEDGITTQLNLTDIVSNLETVTSVTNNSNETFTYTDENGVETIIPIADNDNDATNEIQDISTDATAGNIALSNGSSLTLNVDDADADATNEIQTITSTDNTVNVTANGDDYNLSVTIPVNNDNDATNEIQDISTDATAGNIALSNGSTLTLNVDDADADATNEIQTILSSDNTVNVTANGDDYDLSVTIPVNNDNDATNEIQDISTDATAGNIALSNGSTLTLNVDDADADATNEIQTITSTDNTVNVTANGDDYNLSVTIPVNNDNDATNEIQDISTDATAGNIALSNGSTLTLNVDDADADATNEIQTITSTDNTVNVTANGDDYDLSITIPVNNDNDATNEIQDISTDATAGNIALSNGSTLTLNVNDADADPTNEIQTITSTDNTVNVTPNGDDYNLSVTIPVNNDNDATNEIQDISTDATAGNIALSNGSTLTLNVDDADADSTNEIQTLSQVGNVVTLSNGGQTVSVADNDNDATNEIQTITSVDESVLVTPNGDDFDLSITIPQNNDNDATNEITTVTDNLNGTTTITDVNGGTVVVDNDGIDNVDDADHDITNELQDISLNGTELQLSNPATAGNVIDLTDQITLPMFANGNNNNDEIYWNGTDWVYGTRVASVNLITPDADGNINIPIGNVYTGPTTNTGDIGTIEVGGTPQEGDIYVVNSDATDQTQVGNTFIYDADSSSWIEIDPFNAALYDPRYVNVNGDTMAGNLDMNGNTVTGLSLPSAASDATPKSYVDAVALVDNGDGTFSLNNPDGTIDTVNKASLTDNSNGTFTFNNNDGNPVTIDIAALEATTNLTDNGNQTFTYINEDNTPITFSIADNDNDATNEIQTITSTDGSVNIIENGDDYNLSVTIPINNDNDATNEIQDISTDATAGNIALSNGSTLTLNVDDADADATNEIQTITSTDGSVNITENGDDYNLSVTIPVNNDNDATNEIQDISTDATAGNIALSNGSTLTLNVDDADADATNEIQTITSTDGSVNITENGDDYNLSVTIPVNNDNDATNEIQDISTNATAGNIALSNGSTLTLNVDDADADATNEIQTITSTDGSVNVTANGDDYDLSVTIPVNNDNDATNEIQDISTNATAGNIALSNGSTLTLNVDDADADATNEIQTITSTDGSVNITENGDDYDLSVTIPINNDNDATNEIQDISTNATAGNIALSNGSTLTLNVDDADADATNEIQTLSISGNEITISGTGGNTINLPSEINTTISQNTDNTDTEVTNGNANTIATYTNENNVAVTINETVSKLTNNGDGSFTYTDEIGTETSFTPSPVVTSTLLIDQSFLAKAEVSGDSNEPDEILTLTSLRADSGWTISGNEAVFNDTADYVKIDAMAYMNLTDNATYQRINPELELLKNGVVVARSATGYQRHNSGHNSSSNTISYVDHNPVSGDVYKLRGQQGANQNDIVNIELGHFDLIAVKKVEVIQTITTN